MSEDITYIPKNKPKLKSLDYEFLREKGLEHIESLSHKIWTDYNIHDPGITILEILCYALTDLGYRTSFDIKDILAEGGTNIKNFFSASEILSCNPITINDFRKLMIDVKGVKNAWIELSKTQDPQLFADYKKSILTTEFKKDRTPVNLKGLFDIKLELDEVDIYGDLNDFTWEILVNERTFATLSLPNWSAWSSYSFNTDKVSGHTFEFVGFSADKKSVALKFTVKTDEEVITLGASLNFSQKITLSVSEIMQALELVKIEDTIRDYFLRLGKAIEVVQEVTKRLHAHRNLCEDYKDIEPIEIEDVRLCLDVEVEADAEIEQVLADIYESVGTFMAPDIPFYTLEELLDAGSKVEEIFVGPALNHGFIQDSDLDKTTLRTVINSSDLIQLIMDIPGVVAVRDIQIANSFKGTPLTAGEKWSLDITAGRASRLDIPNSKVVFYKGLTPYYANKGTVNNYLEEKRLLKRSAKQRYDKHDVDIQQGEDYKLSTYTSIQEEFPLNYGIGRFGISGGADEKRQAQAYQLKGYLLIMDQILANYLSQLSHIRDLLSMKSDVSRMAFYQALYESTNLEDSISEDLPNIDKLIAAFNQETDDWSTFKEDVNNSFIKQLRVLTESKADFQSRRNRMLDHLMARFNEKFSDYVLLSYQLDGTKGTQELIDDKEEFLQEYPTLSHDRGKAFNYYASDALWDSDNVSGLEKRLARITGIKSYDRTSLYREDAEDLFHVYKDNAGEWRFHYSSYQGKKLLHSEGYTGKSGMKNGIESVLENGVLRANYELRTSSDNRFYYVLKARNGHVIGESGLFPNRRRRTEALLLLIKLLNNEYNEEGFHLVEHILLRPKETDDQLMPVCIEPGCESPGCVDPYSFRVTLVLPAWAGRFTSMDFRRHFEQTARLEAPAHVHVKICWVNKEDMLRFEDQYKSWLEENAKPYYEQNNRQSILLSFINTLNQIKSVYPEATLHDCEESSDNPVLLGYTSLGSSKTILS